MKILRIARFLKITALPVLFACNASGGGAPGPVPPPSPAAGKNRPMPAVNASFGAAQTDFGLELFKRIVLAQKNRNIFVSPSSVAAALAMTYNGAGGDTKTAMEKTLRLAGLTMDQVNQAAGAWLKALEKPAAKVELSMANSIWVRDGVPLRPSFRERLEQHFDSMVADLDFGRADAADTINGWVRGRTKGKIEDIVASPISADKMLFLINALYFKGEWSERFDPKQTHDAPFTLIDGTVVQVPTMSRTGEFETKNSDRYQAVRMPYGDGRFAMYIYVPAEGKTVHDLAEGLTPGEWTSMTSGFAKRRVPLTMPKFTSQYGVTLNDTLKAMGMAVAFDPDRSDLGGMVDDGWLGVNRLFISEVKHKTYVEVNEEGTEAAASTSVGISVTSVPLPFAVDRPFLSVIHDGATDSILFVGTVMDPRDG